MSQVISLRPLAALALFCLLLSGASAVQFDPLVVVYCGRMSGYAEALAGIISESGTKAIAARSDSVLRGLIDLPQTRCVVIAALNPADYDFLREVAPVLESYFQEGGSLVGIGACCSNALDPLSSTIFPIRGNATVRGIARGDTYGSVYVLVDPVPGISSGLPSRFVIVQSDATYESGSGGPIEPHTDLGQLRFVYRDEATGIPLLVALEREGGGRSVSMPGCYVATVERLPFYWGKLVDQEEFRALLGNSVLWAMEGCSRYDRLASSVEEDLKTEADRALAIEEEGRDSLRRARGRRVQLLVGLWAVALVFQGFLLVRYIIPRFSSSREPPA